MDSVRQAFDSELYYREDLLFVMDDKLGIVYADGRVEYYDSNKNGWKLSPWSRDLVLDYNEIWPDLVEFISTV